MCTEGDRTDGCGEVTAGSGSGLRSGRKQVQTLPLTHAGSPHQLASRLRVPITTLASDLRPRIEGKQTEGGWDHLRIQVLLWDAENGTHMTLQDDTGVFGEFEPPDPEDSPPSDISEVGSGCSCITEGASCSAQGRAGDAEGSHQRGVETEL